MVRAARQDFWGAKSFLKTGFLGDEKLTAEKIWGADFGAGLKR